MNENLITIPELCKELGIGRTTAYKMIHSGKLPMVTSVERLSSTVLP